MKNILVISYPRSGTHFLINSIFDNFKHLYERPYRLVPPANKVDELKRYFEIEISRGEKNKIYKSHHSYDVFKKLMPIINDNFCIFYVYRDGKDVMTSYMNYCNTGDNIKYPKTKTMTEFLKINPHDWKLGGEYDLKDSDNLVHQWKRHSDKWIYKNQDFSHLNIYIFNYANLYDCFIDELDRIACILDEPVDRHNIIIPKYNKNVIRPYKGKSNCHKEFFTEKDYRRFQCLVDSA